MRYSSGRLSAPLGQQRRARAVLPRKIAMIKVVTSMLAGSKRSEEGSLGRHPPG